MNRTCHVRMNKWQIIKPGWVLDHLDITWDFVVLKNVGGGVEVLERVHRDSEMIAYEKLVKQFLHNFVNG